MYRNRQDRPAIMNDSSRLTNKQYQILSTVIDGTVDDENKPAPLDLDQLLERLPYRTTRDSLQFSLRALEARRLIVRDYEKRRGRRHALIIPTKLALKVLTSQFETPRESTPYSLSLIS